MATKVVGMLVVYKTIRFFNSGQNRLAMEKTNRHNIPE